MVGKLFSGKPNPEVQALLRTLIPPEVGQVSDEAIDKASGPRGQGMLELLGFAGYSLMDAMMGQSEIRGARHGRDVALFFGMSGSKPTVTTRVTVSAPPFEVSFKDKDARLESMGLPPGVLDVIRQQGPLDKGVSVKGTSGGITVDRKRSSKDAASWKGTIQWLNDVRLAESLADVFSSS
jgi:hypothetical protein